MTDKPYDPDPGSLANNRHHQATYLEEAYWNDPDQHSPYNPDILPFYPGQQEAQCQPTQSQIDEDITTI